MHRELQKLFTWLWEIKKMKIMISPAKKMNRNTDSLETQGLPIYIKETEIIKTWMQSQSFDNLKKLWNCNDKIAEQNFERVKAFDLYNNLTPAILSYEGIQYQYMAPTVFESKMLCYVQEHLRILSGFYGVLKPMDGIIPYRLEMQAKAAVAGCRDLYAYWGTKLYDEVMDTSHIVINLASKEYSRCIEKYLTEEDICITCVFAELVDGKVTQKGTYAKMARGEMVRFMAEREIENPEEIKTFDRLGYVFREDLSNDKEYIFLK